MIHKTILFLIALFIASGCAHRPPTGVLEHETDLQGLCYRYAIQWQLDPVTQVVTLIKGSARAKALIESNVVVLNDNKISLSSSLKKVQGKIIVPGDFKRKVIDLLLQSSVYTLKKFREIVIDPGHGGKDPGARGKFGTEEKNIVLDIAQRLRRNLEQNGIKVIMTRTKDEFISLEKRTEIASQSKSDLFVSIHANASRMKNARGMEIYYLRELDTSEKNEDQVKENKKILFKQYAMSRNSFDLENILSDMLYSYKRAESQALCNYVTQKTAGVAHALNRGSKTAGFFVLRNTLIPAILVEVGFLSNPSEERLLKSIDYRQKIADGLARSILEYAND